MISSATVSNWKRLHTDTNGRLTKRANKRNSQKRMIPIEYLLHKENASDIEIILSMIEKNNWEIQDVMYSLCLNCVDNAGITEKESVKRVMDAYKQCEVIEPLRCIEIPSDEFDFVGAVYQSVLIEGSKNKMGSYYTPLGVSHKMTKELIFSDNQTFLDPCCGSGSFLLSLSVRNPQQIYGVDTDPVAVMIAKFNLLCKYADYDFAPQIYCYDFIEPQSLIADERITEDTLFDYICTNPPWGAVTSQLNYSDHITSGEAFSIFFVESFMRLKPDGIIRFLFPESILNVKTHKDIREYILSHCRLESITFYQESFTGVVTSYVDIKASRTACGESVDFYLPDGHCKIEISSFRQSENVVFHPISSADREIIEKVNAVSPHSLADSIWALGIVTGDNKKKLFDSPGPGMEPIYTGKEISPYLLLPVRKYIVYDRKQFQQAARDEYYRAPEKLVYKFISNKLVFAYDDTRSLFLNSANIVIPDIPDMSVKTVMAFLNSDLYQFLYTKLFGEIKILKGNLTKLPFPSIDQKTNDEIESLVDNILSTGGHEDVEKIQTMVYSVFHLTEKQIQHIKENT